MTATRFDALVVAPATLAAAAVLYAAWRVTPSREDGWVTATVTMLGMQCLMLFGLQIVATGEVTARPFWMVVVDALCLAGVLATARLAATADLRIDPGWLGCLVGSALGLVRILAVLAFPRVTATRMTELFVVGITVALLAAVVVAVLRVRALGIGTRLRLAVAVSALTAAHLAWYLTGRTALGARVTMWLDIVGASVLLFTAVESLRRSLRAERAEAQELSHRLQEVEADIRDRRARMHEINSTIAGIASATQVISENRRTTAERCRELEGMVQTELARLERLLAAPAPSERPAADRPPTGSERPLDAPSDEVAGDRYTPLDRSVFDGPVDGVVELDDTIGMLALSQEVRGNAVRWLPSGECVSADPDAVTEVLNILLDNAAKHGGGHAEVAVDRCGDLVEIAVHDPGPGVAPEIRESLFQWGARGPSSRGQGIGLHIAATLAEEQGGYLRLDPSDRPGTTFVIGLHAVRERDGAAAQPA